MDSLLREVTWNVDKTEEKIRDSESSRLWVFEIADVDYIRIHSFQAMNLNSRNFRRESFVRKVIRENICMHTCHEK